MALTRVTSKVIQDGTISTADLSTASKSSISGSFNETSSSFSTRTTTLESASSSFAGDLVTIKGSGTTQGVGQSNSPTFSDSINSIFVPSSVSTRISFNFSFIFQAFLTFFSTSRIL